MPLPISSIAVVVFDGVERLDFEGPIACSPKGAA
jgi:hypothetical protein